MHSSGTQPAAPLLPDLEATPSIQAETTLAPPQALKNGGLAATFRSLRHRNYRLYFFGQMISLVGTWMQTTVVLWLAFDLEKQPKWPPLVAAAGILPTFLFGAWGGSLADRWPKRPLIFRTQTAFAALAFLLAGLVWFRAVTPWQLFVISAVTGLVTAIDLPARLAFVLDMVDRDDLMNAVALNSLLFNVARALGPAIAGFLLVWGGTLLCSVLNLAGQLPPATTDFLLTWGGAFLCFLINGLSYLAVLWALARMNVDGAPSREKSEKPRASLLGGFHYLAQHRELAFLTLLAGAVGLCGWPSQALMPAFASHTLGGGEREYSWMLTATGIGALLAAWVVATFGTVDRKDRLITVGVAVIAFALIGLSFARHLAGAVVACGSIGFGLILVLSTSQSVMQLSAGKHNRGQIMGIWAMVLSGAVPLGNFLTAPVAELWGAPRILLLLGTLCGGTSLVLLMTFRPWLSSRPNVPPP
jgi:MFS family permease